MNDLPTPPKTMRGKRITPRMVCDEWWEANAPAEWQSGQCPHGLVVGKPNRHGGTHSTEMMPFPKQIKHTAFLGWLVKNRPLLETARALLQEAETRYLELDLRVRRLVTPNAAPQPLPTPYAIAWHSGVGRYGYQSSYRHRDGYSPWLADVSRADRLRASLATTSSSSRWFFLALNPDHPWQQVMFEGVADGASPYSRLHSELDIHAPVLVMQEMLERVFPVDRPRNPFEPLVDLWRHHGVRSESLSTTLGLAPRLPLIYPSFPEEAYNLEGAP